MKNLTLSEFTARTASGEPTPGGGSVSALAGALAAALTGMVAALTAGREKYAEVSEEMAGTVISMKELSEELLNDVSRDCSSFDQFMAALSLPKNTPEEKNTRAAAMQEGLKAAVDVPLSVAEKASSVFPYAKRMVEAGNPTALSDALVAAMLARTCILSAACNVKINLRSIRDEKYAARIRAQIRKLEDEAVAKEEQILRLAALN